MKQPNSPLPWKIDDSKDLPLGIIQDNEDGEGVVEGNYTIAEERQDFEYIVEACNNYPKVIEKLQSLKGRVNRTVFNLIKPDELYKEIETFLKSL